MEKCSQMMQKSTEGSRLSKIADNFSITSTSYMPGIAVGFLSSMKRSLKLCILARTTHGVCTI